jgi:hypothetical protein
LCLKHSVLKIKETARIEMERRGKFSLCWHECKNK